MNLSVLSGDKADETRPGLSLKGACKAGQSSASSWPEREGRQAGPVPAMSDGAPESGRNDAQG